MSVSLAMRLLVIGWVEGQSNLLSALSASNCSLDYAPSMHDALRTLQQEDHRADAIVLNGAAGFDVYTATAVLRLYSSLPIVLIFTHPFQVNPGRAVDAGADEWQLNTIHPRELCARIFARIRRYRIMQTSNAVIERYGSFSLNPRTHELITNARTIRLTPAEMHVLRRLASSPLSPVPAHELAVSLDMLPHEQTGGDHLTAVVRQLRSKLAGTSATLLSLDNSAYLLHS
ncbi:MAG: hypothetical protein R2873_14935 [Caldilineaceae bacterium]